MSTFLFRDLSRPMFPVMPMETTVAPPAEGQGLLSGQITIGNGTRIRVFDAEPGKGPMAYYLTPPFASKRDALRNLKNAQLPAMKRPQYRYVYPVNGYFDPLSSHGEAIEDLNAELARYDVT